MELISWWRVLTQLIESCVPLVFKKKHNDLWDEKVNLSLLLPNFCLLDLVMVNISRKYMNIYTFSSHGSLSGNVAESKPNLNQKTFEHPYRCQFGHVFQKTTKAFLDICWAICVDDGGVCPTFSGTYFFQRTQICRSQILNGDGVFSYRNLRYPPQKYPPKNKV